MSQVVVKTTNGLSQIAQGTTSQVLVGGSSPAFGNVPSAAVADSLITDWGDGSDGAVTISTTVTLTKSMFYTTLVIANGGVLNTASFPIYALTSVTVQNGGIIQNNGTAGLANNNSGRNGAAAGFYFGAGKGGNGTTTNGATGNGPSGIILGGAGGTGGNGSSGTGGAGGSTGVTPVDSGFYRTLQARELMWTPSGSAANTQGGYGPGGGGGGGAGNGSGSGGGGGGGGGIIMIKSPSITVNSGGIIQANGGDGGLVNILTNNGGGGGGGGGVISLIYRSYTNSGTVQAAGGAGGTALGGGGGTSGSSGSSGQILTKQLV